MIKIIEKGKKEFETQCMKCECKFSYELEDLDKDNHVECPNCKDKINHSNQVLYFLRNHGIPFTS